MRSFVVGVALCFASAGGARAEQRSSTRITPEKPGDNRWAFEVKVARLKRADAPDTLEFTVKATPKTPKEKRLPDLSAGLEVRDGAKHIFDSRLESKTENDDSIYTFRISEAFAAKSVFTFGETDERLPINGIGGYCWFHPADFVPAPKAGADDDPPAKTPFDDNQQKAKDYRTSFIMGRQWARGLHLACPTNPSDENRHAIRGWVEGWLAGVKSGGESGLPAKYVPFLAWAGNAPAENPEERWDASKFPKLTGKLVGEMGHANSYVPPEKGDGFTLDFASIGKLQRLSFDHKKPGDTYLSLYGPLKLARVNANTKGGFSNCRFTSWSGDHLLHIDIQPKPGRGEKRFVEVFITAEWNGLVQHAAVIECLADGDFPAQRGLQPTKSP